MALIKIKLNRNWKTHKQGEVVEVNYQSAIALVADKSAEYVKAMSKPPKDKMFKGNKNK